MKKNAVFIAATGQNVGKSTLCLGTLAALRKRYSSVGFIKPVGQQHVKIDGNINVDKDVVLFKEYFHLEEAWEDMSPVIIPRGFTRDYLDKKIDSLELNDHIMHAFDRIYAKHPFTLVEGTGHVGVGSIVQLNNAQVARSLGLDIVIIVSGGLGSAHDELALNFAMCKQFGVKVRGVILNRVLEDKKEMITKYISKALQKWEIPLIGCVPYNEFLSNPTISDFQQLFDTELISGHKHCYRHFQHTRLVATSLEVYKKVMQPNELVITPAAREDIIHAILKKHLEFQEQHNQDFEGGLILTSRHPPSKEVVAAIRKVDIPVLYAPLYSYDAMKKITSFIAKIRLQDTPKIEKAIELVEQSVDFSALCGE